MKQLKRSLFIYIIIQGLLRRGRENVRE